MIPSQRIQSLPVYAFAAVDEAKDELAARGVDVIDFGVGDHTLPSPAVAREKLKTAVDAHATTGYPSYVGSKNFRQAVADWTKRRFGVQLDPATEICSTIGSKEGVFHLPLAFINPGDTVIVPTPGYPPYSRGTLFAGGKSWFTPLSADNGWQIDFERIPQEVAHIAKILWICYPNSPTGAQGSLEFFEKAVKWCADNDVLLVSDEAYSELYFDDANKPHTVLEVSRKNVLVMNSMSKRSMMTGWRIGWVAGDAECIKVFKKLKTNIDSGTPDFIQDGAVAALNDEAHVKEMRDVTKQKRDILADALVAAGLPDCRPESTLYHWQKVPAGMSGLDFAKALLVDDIGVVCTPGEWISDAAHDGTNPGAGYVRFALVPPVDRVKVAAERIRNATFGE
ncbi:MAG: aminotransferase class I/II-fold pyridoxal phosphate-dependent enzyme [Planctomycetota bacterium]